MRSRLNAVLMLDTCVKAEKRVSQMGPSWSESMCLRGLSPCGMSVCVAVQRCCCKRVAHVCKHLNNLLTAECFA